MEKAPSLCVGMSLITVSKGKTHTEGGVGDILEMSERIITANWSKHSYFSEELRYLSFLLSLKQGKKKKPVVSRSENSLMELKEGENFQNWLWVGCRWHFEKIKAVSVMK